MISCLVYHLHTKQASYEGKVAAEVISGQASEVDYIGMPAVCFTEPELAQVGYTEAQAKEEGLDFKASKFLMLLTDVHYH